MIQYFQSLGEGIERAWLERSYDEEIFPQLARDELDRNPPTEHVEVADILDWIFGPSQTFRQPNHRDLFGSHR